MHNNMINFHVRTLAREQVGWCLLDVMTVVRVQDDVCVCFVFVTFPLYCLFQCELVWCATARKGAGMCDDDCGVV